MQDYSDGVMIALLPTDSSWCELDLPHMTLVYAGTVDDLSPNDFNELGKAASNLAVLSKPIVVSVTKVDVFGNGEKVDVLRLKPTPELLAMRAAVEAWNASEFPFRPHVTIGPEGSSISKRDILPRLVRFDRILVQFGEESLTFGLRHL